MICLKRRAFLPVAALAIAALAVSCGSKSSATATATSPVTGVPTAEVPINPTLPPQQAGAAVLFVIDQGSSMGEAFGDTTKWAALETAFADNGPGSALESLSNHALVGMSMFSGSPGENGCPLKAGTSPSVGTLSGIASIIADAEPLSGSPASEALHDAAGTLAVYPGSRTIVLITDGPPTSCDSAETVPQAEDAAIGEVLDAYSRRTVTRVIALGDDADQAYLQGLANAGVGIPPSADSATYEDAQLWRAHSLSELEDAIKAVAEQVTPIS